MQRLPLLLRGSSLLLELARFLPLSSTSWGSDMLGGLTNGNQQPAITVNHLTMAYDSFVLMRALNFMINHGHIFIIMDGSGRGKRTLLSKLIRLNEPARV